MRKLRRYLALKILDFGIWFLETGKNEGGSFTSLDEMKLEEMKKLRMDTFNGA